VAGVSSPKLIEIERQLRSLLPADLYARVWIDPSADMLMRVFEHLRTLQHILVDYVPREVSHQLPQLHQVRYGWQQGSLMFTDLAGFTPLFEAKAVEGRAGAEALLILINDYFAQMIEIISKSGGNLLEFTGDALLVQFHQERHSHGEKDAEVAQAVYAGLRMQRAMEQFTAIATPQGSRALKMRVGIHAGRFVAADIGSPMRMGHVLMGRAVQRAKQTEGAGKVGQVCLSQTGCDRILSGPNRFRLAPNQADNWLIIDDLSPETLGEYDITLTRRRAASPILFDRSVPGLLSEIQTSIHSIEPLASYLPRAVLQLLVNTAAARRIPPSFPVAAVAFVNLMGLPEAVDDAQPEETDAIVTCFSHAFALINGAVELHDGILQKVTYHSVGSEILIHFGVLNPDPSDPRRAAAALLAIRDCIASLPPPTVQGQPIRLTCRIGLTYGPLFAAEIGEPRGRREFNVLGDTVNTAARLMSRATENQILIDDATATALKAQPQYHCQPLGPIALKGKSRPQPIYALNPMPQA
jgi:adenylate cyclase